MLKKINIMKKNIFEQYPSLHRMFKILPKLHQGESKEFNGTKEDFHFAQDIIESMGSTILILKRTKYLMDDGKLNVNEWIDSIKTENTFQSYMINNFSLVDGVFIFDKEPPNLEKLTEIMLSYYDK